MLYTAPHIESRGFGFADGAGLWEASTRERGEAMSSQAVGTYRTSKQILLGSASLVE